MKVDSMQDHAMVPHSVMKSSAYFKVNQEKSVEEKESAAQNSELDVFDKQQMIQHLEKELNFSTNHSFRFSVIDPTHVGSRNIVIEVVDEKGKVITTIPNESVRKLVEQMKLLRDPSPLKGLLFSV